MSPKLRLGDIISNFITHSIDILLMHHALNLYIILPVT